MPPILCLKQIVGLLDPKMAQLFMNMSYKALIFVTPLLEECEDDTHIPEMGTWESFGTLETSELNYRRSSYHWKAIEM